MENIETKIMTWKRQLEQDKSEKARLEGQMESILNWAKEEHDCRSIEELEELLEKTKTSAAKLNERVLVLAKNYEDKYYGAEDA